MLWEATQSSTRSLVATNCVYGYKTLIVNFVSVSPSCLAHTALFYAQWGTENNYQSPESKPVSLCRVEFRMKTTSEIWWTFVWIFQSFHFMLTGSGARRLLSDAGMSLQSEIQHAQQSCMMTKRTCAGRSNNHGADQSGTKTLSRPSSCTLC